MEEGAKSQKLKEIDTILNKSVELGSNHLAKSAKMIDLAMTLQNEIENTPSLKEMKFEDRRNAIVSKYCILYEHSPLLFDSAVRCEMNNPETKETIELFGKYRNDPKKLLRMFDLMQLKRNAKSVEDGLKNINSARDIKDEDKVKLAQQAQANLNSLRAKIDAITMYIDQPDKISIAIDRNMIVLDLANAEEEVKEATTDSRIPEEERPKVLQFLSQRIETIKDELAKFNAKLQ